MYKKVFGLLLTLPLVLNGIAVSAAQSDDEEKIFPTGLSEYNAIEIPEEELQNYVVEMPEQTNDMYVLSDDMPSFYSCGSDYGYNFLGTLKNGPALQDCYSTLKELSETFAASANDAAKIENNGENLYLLTSFEYIPGYPGRITFPALSEEDVVNVYYTFRQDHPEYYWLSTTIHFGLFNNRAYLMPIIDEDYAKFSKRSELDSVMDENFNKILKKAEDKMPDMYMAIMQVHDDICDATDYGYDPEGNPLNTPEAHNIQGVLDGDGKADAVCESYAKTTQLLLNALGIPNVLVVGMANGGGHAWNTSMLNDGKYYYFDVTWDDRGNGTKTKNYFARGSSGFAGVVSFANDSWDFDGYRGDTPGIHYPYSKALADAMAAEGYNAFGYFQYDLPEISVNDYVYTPITDKIVNTSITAVSGGGYRISPDRTLPNGCKLYTAQYDRYGTLIDVKITNDEVTLTPEAGTVEIKAFVLNSSLKPYSDMKRVKIR